MEKTSRQGFVLYVAPALLCVGMIFWLGSVKTVVGPEELWSKDKVNHCLAFGVLAVLFQRAIRFKFAKLRAFYIIAASVIASSVIGALLEVWQSFLPYRSSELLDWVADTFGAVLAVLMGLAWNSWRRRRA